MNNTGNHKHSLKISRTQEGHSRSSRITGILDRLQNASRKLAVSADHHEILKIVPFEFVNFFSAKVCFVSLWDEEKNQFFRTASSRSKDWFENSESDFPILDKSIKTSDFEDKSVRHLSISRLNGNWNQAKKLTHLGIKSLLLVPLISSESLVGLIELYDDRERDYQDEELMAARILAAHAATALEANKVYLRLEKSIKEQEALHDASLAISSTLDINGILTKIAEEVCSLVDATSVYISKYDPDVKVSKGIVEFYGPHANQKEKVSDLGKINYHEYDFRDVVRMFDTGNPLLYSLDDLDVESVERRYVESYGGKSVMEIPLQVSGEFLGIIEIWDSRRNRDFSPEEIYLCETIAQQAAIALGNAKLYEKAQDEIKARKELEAKLRYDAFHDVLTKLPNRLLFYDRLEQAILRHKRSFTSNFAVLYVDLDRFKSVNDSFGHMTGDIVLVQAAKAIKECVREGDTVSRFGGDEFLILLNGNINSEAIKNITDRIQENLKSIKIDKQHQLFLSASIGLVMSTYEIETADEYLKSADVAMYVAKMKGGARVEVFSPTQELKSKEKVFIQLDILRAAKQQEFQVHFQPIINLHTYEIFGFEALLRWKKANEYLVNPSKFIAQLESLGLISDVGNWVIREAINNFKKWESANPEFADLSLSVNVSNNQLIHPDFLQEIRNILETTKFNPSRLTIEVTESLFISDLPLVTDTLADLRELGLNVHLDDFGTGFSSLSYLSDLPVNGLKIDRKFIKKIGPHLANQGLLVSILAMANDLGLNVIAEGIEKEIQLITLIGLNCQLGQGFLFSPGLPPNEVEEFVNRSWDEYVDFDLV